ncbi:MAG: M48 family metallopeptidase [bacterium]|nr:M48 family metallopeptidase [bacterium]
MAEIVNFYESSQKNVEKTILLIIGFIVFMIFFAYVIGGLIGDSTSLVFFAFIFSLGSSFVSYYYSDKIVLSLSKAKPATKEEHFDFYTVVENISIGTGIPMPKLYVIDDSAMNAFATGRDKNHSAVVATTGLLSRLDRSEIEGVMAHELSHIGNKDILLMSVVAVLVGTIVLVVDWVWRIRFFGGGDDNNKNSNGIFLIVAVVSAIVAPIIAQVIKLAISRQREYLADATAVKFTRNPNGLISALSKLNQDSEKLEVANRATAHLYITNPFKVNSAGFGKSINLLFSTHPPIEDRITRLSNM